MNNTNYTNCWLTYPRLLDETRKELTVSCAFTGAADSALEELTLSFGKLYGRKLLRRLL